MCAMGQVDKKMLMSRSAVLFKKLLKNVSIFSDFNVAVFKKLIINKVYLYG